MICLLGLTLGAFFLSHAPPKKEAYQPTHRRTQVSPGIYFGSACGPTFDSISVCLDTRSLSTLKCAANRTRPAGRPAGRPGATSSQNGRFRPVFFSKIRKAKTADFAGETAKNGRLRRCVLHEMRLGSRCPENGAFKGGRPTRMAGNTYLLYAFGRLWRSGLGPVHA